MEDKIISRKFMCVTQCTELHSFSGPSGKRYTSKLGEYFHVLNKMDVEYFEKYPQRFHKKGIKDIVSPPSKKVDMRDGKAKFSDYLDEIKGLTKYTKKKLLMRYDDKGTLIDELEQGAEIQDILTNRQYQLLHDYTCNSDFVKEDKEGEK